MNCIKENVDLILNLFFWGFCLSILMSLVFGFFGAVFCVSSHLIGIDFISLLPSWFLHFLFFIIISSVIAESHYSLQFPYQNPLFFIFLKQNILRFSLKLFWCLHFILGHSCNSIFMSFHYNSFQGNSTAARIPWFWQLQWEDFFMDSFYAMVMVGSGKQFLTVRVKLKMNPLCFCPRV